MPTLNKLLKVYKTKHPELGEIIELYAPNTSDLSRAFFVNISRGEVEGVGIRITKKTALKLADALTLLAQEAKVKKKKGT